MLVYRTLLIVSLVRALAEGAEMLRRVPFDLIELLIVGVSTIQTCNSFSCVDGLGVSIE